eukprot:gene24244-biopygen7381
MSGSLGDLRRGEGAIPRPWNVGGGPRRAMRRGQQTIHSMFARAALRPRPSPPPPPEVAASAVPPVADAGRQRGGGGRRAARAAAQVTSSGAAKGVPFAGVAANSGAEGAGEKWF